MPLELEDCLFEGNKLNIIGRNKVYAHGTVTEEQQKIGRAGIDREKIQPGGKLTVVRHRTNAHLDLSLIHI